MRPIRNMAFLAFVVTMLVWPGPPFTRNLRAMACSAGATLGGCWSETECYNGAWRPTVHGSQLDELCWAGCGNIWTEDYVDAVCDIDLSACPNPQYPVKIHISVPCQENLPSCYPNGWGFCSSGSQCCSGICNSDTGYCDNQSPILINLRNNTGNFHLTSLEDGVEFDITGDGVLKQMAWTEPNSHVAFLAMDRNDNGQIDNGSELFGDATWLSNGQKARNGFEALKDLDGPPLLRDGQIDQDDEVFPRLRLWLDRNHNGVSESDELISLETAGLVTIFTDYRESRRVDQHGNAYRYIGKAMARERNGRLAPRRVVDVFFKVGP